VKLMFPMKKPTLLARKHFGGTLTGFVIGLLVGLGIALSVAVYVTRVPVPFVDRGVSRKPAQDVEEAERNKGWNPNAGLTTSPATVPPPVVIPDPAPAPVLAAPAESPTAGKPVAQQPATAPTQADPLGELMRSRTGAANGAAPPAGAPAHPKKPKLSARVSPCWAWRPTSASGNSPGAPFSGCALDPSTRKPWPTPPWSNSRSTGWKPPWCAFSAETGACSGTFARALETKQANTRSLI
jgi:hypothetical protein